MAFVIDDDYIPDDIPDDYIFINKYSNFRFDDNKILLELLIKQTVSNFVSQGINNNIFPKYMFLVVKN